MVAWGTPPDPPPDMGAPATGIYVVALTDKLEDLDAVRPVAPVSMAAVDELLKARRELTLDGTRPTCEQLATRLGAFWFPDEVVLYIGLAGPRRRRPPDGEVAHRVGEYYKTRLGARSPHAGGWPLKTLACLSDLFVHYGYCNSVDDAEKAAIGQFAKHVSDATLAGLRDRDRVMPFANLEFPKGNSKNHGIRRAREPRKPRAEKRTEPVASEKRATPALPTEAKPVPRRPPSTMTQRHPSQNVTENDIEVGQVRIPIGPAKAILPHARTDITVVLRGRDLGTCRWDPRYGADKERSGVIRVGKAAARELLTPGDVLAVSVAGDDVVSLD